MNSVNYNLFKNTLANHFSALFSNDAAYELIKTKHSPISLADIITERLLRGCADKEGKGVILTCKELKIKHTYKAIEAFLKE